MEIDKDLNIAELFNLASTTIVGFEQPNPVFKPQSNDQTNVQIRLWKTAPNGRISLLDMRSQTWGLLTRGGKKLTGKSISPVVPPHFLFTPKEIEFAIEDCVHNPSNYLHCLLGIPHLVEHIKTLVTADMYR